MRSPCQSARFWSSIYGDRDRWEVSLSDQAIRDAAIHAVSQLSEAIDSAVDTLTLDYSVTLSVLEGLRTTQPIASITVINDMATHRQRLTNTLDQLERARGQARTAMFRALQYEGLSVGRISRLWGISRQLTSRTLHDRVCTNASASE